MWSCPVQLPLHTKPVYLTILGLEYASGYLMSAQMVDQTYREIYFAVGMDEGSHPIFRLFGSSTHQPHPFLSLTVNAYIIDFHPAYQLYSLL